MLKLKLLRQVPSTTLLAMCGTLSAAPATFEFVLPPWGTSNPAGAVLYGPVGTIEVTVDNGSSATTNEAYAFREITKVHLTAGSYSNTWLVGDAYIDIGPDFDFIFTDGVGVPTLDLTPNPNPGSRIVFSNAAGTWQFGVGSLNNSSYTAVWLENTPQFGGGAIAFTSNGFSAVGSVVEPNAVPLPASGSLVLLGLAGLALHRRIGHLRMGNSNAPIS